MHRNTVIVDGTRRGPRCNAVTADQNFGPRTAHGPESMNGIEVFRADHVSVENLTVCNFLGGAGTPATAFGGTAAPTAAGSEGEVSTARI